MNVARDRRDYIVCDQVCQGTAAVRLCGGQWTRTLIACLGRRLSVRAIFSLFL